MLVSCPMIAQGASLSSKLDQISSHLKPLSYAVDANNNITIAGLKVKDLLTKYGSPLYILCEETIRTRARLYVNAFKEFYSGESLVIYASKALNCKAVCKIIDSEGLGIDVVSGGELFTALSVGFPKEKIIFHGNNKGKDELEMAIENQIGSIMLDNFYELELISELLREKFSVDTVVNLSIRVTPGIECHTHEYIKTGRIDSKFGFDLSQVDELISRILALKEKYKNINIKGLHAHIGSQIFETMPHNDVAGVLLNQYKSLKDKYGISLQDINVGGGLGIKYHEHDDPPEINDWVKVVADSIVANCKALNLDLPRVIVEPGRSIVGPAGITAYKVGNIKNIPNLRKFVAVDGGMADNVRHIMYQARYYAEVDGKIGDAKTEKVTIAGKFCESGDILIRDIDLPELNHDDVLVVYSTGAYNYSMASNYNRVRRPAMLLVNNGRADIIIRRETYEDVVQWDELPQSLS
ncbi:MAG: diaminopimelate decarboxylase [Cyanobacteria bacterium REEB446]|nr:diaminopimelate decarboxylase [Cyanobacteria bacterium REEB446]